jgi:1-acyl-sn-glycerol-3-phosphate acyltransferase
LRGLVKQAKAAIADGRSIVIFPEGTRVAPGDQRPYQVGTAALYRQLGVPVVPVALNSGLFWGRRKWTKRPGVITLEILPPIAPGLSRDAFMETLRERIETATARLVERP